MKIESLLLKSEERLSVHTIRMDSSHLPELVTYRKRPLDMPATPYKQLPTQAHKCESVTVTGSASGFGSTVATCLFHRSILPNQQANSIPVIGNGFGVGVRLREKTNISISMGQGATCPASVPVPMRTRPVRVQVPVQVRGYPHANAHSDSDPSNGAAAAVDTQPSVLHAPMQKQLQHTITLVANATPTPRKITNRWKKHTNRKRTPNRNPRSPKVISRSKSGANACTRIRAHCAPHSPIYQSSRSRSLHAQPAGIQIHSLNQLRQTTIPCIFFSFLLYPFIIS